MFASDVKDRFVSMFTFSDGKVPLGIDAVGKAGLVVKSYFKFNNSAIWEKTDDTQTISFFNLGYDSYHQFSEYVKRENKAGVSTNRSSQVIRQRKALEDLSVRTSKACLAATQNMNKVEGEIKNISLNAQTINSKKNFTFVKERQEYVEVDYGSDVTKCKNCAGRVDKPNQGSCHLGCSVGDDKKNCCAMKEDGYCRVCGCPWNCHINSRSHFKLKTVKSYYNDESIKAQHDEAVSKLDRASKLVVNLLDEQLNLIDELQAQKDILRSVDEFLQQTALRPKPFNNLDYLEEQIKVLEGKGLNDLEKKFTISQRDQRTLTFPIQSSFRKGLS